MAKQLTLKSNRPQPQSHQSLINLVERDPKVAYTSKAMQEMNEVYERMYSSKGNDENA